MLAPVRYMNVIKKGKYDHSGLCLNVVGGYCNKCTKRESCEEYKRKNEKGTI